MNRPTFDHVRNTGLVSFAPGGMPERTNGTVSKTVEAFGSPWVQIPLPPPSKLLVSYAFRKEAAGQQISFWGGSQMAAPLWYHNSPALSGPSGTGWYG